MQKKLYIRTFGCQMNEYDSDKMADVLEASDGLTITQRPEDADVILFNTCSVREKAQERVFHDLGRVRALKAAKRDLVIGVGGCVASQEGAAIVRRAPYVDVVFGPQTLHRLPEMIAQRRATGRAQVDVRRIGNPTPTWRAHRAWWRRLACGSGAAGRREGAIGAGLDALSGVGGLAGGVRWAVGTPRSEWGPHGPCGSWVTRRCVDRTRTPERVGPGGRVGRAWPRACPIAAGRAPGRWAVDGSAGRGGRGWRARWRVR